MLCTYAGNIESPCSQILILTFMAQAKLSSTYDYNLFIHTYPHTRHFKAYKESTQGNSESHKIITHTPITCKPDQNSDTSFRLMARREGRGGQEIHTQTQLIVYNRNSVNPAPISHKINLKKNKIFFVNRLTPAMAILLFSYSHKINKFLLTQEHETTIVDRSNSMNRSKKTNRSETKPLRFHMPKGYKAYPGSTNDLIDIVDTMTGVVCPVLRNQMKYAQKLLGVFA